MTSPLLGIRSEIQAIFEKAGYVNRPAFLKRAPEEDHLFVSDAPRRLPDKAAAWALFEQNGFSLTEKEGLWFLDAPIAYYERLAVSLPTVPPKQPREERFLDVWALACLLLKHPGPVADQPLGPSRQVLKAIETGPGAVLGLVKTLPPTVAVLLRQKAPLPALAGGLLAKWVAEREGKAAD
jgi:hypothetical protein